MNENLINLVNELLISNVVFIAPIKDFSGFRNDLLPWKATLPVESDDRNFIDRNSILGHLGYLSPPEDDQASENEFILLINDRINENKYTLEGLANISCFLSRISWTNGRERDGEVLSNYPKDKIVEIIKLLIDKYNVIEWSNRFKASKRDIYRVKDWERIFQHFDFLPDFHNPFIPLLNLMS